MNVASPLPIHGLVAPEPGAAPAPLTIRLWIEAVPIHATKKLLLQTLTNHVDERDVFVPPRSVKDTDLSTTAWWSARRLGEVLQVTARQVRRLVRSLSAEGLLRWHAREWAAPRYELLVENIERAARRARPLAEAARQRTAAAYRGEPDAEPSRPRGAPLPAPTPNRARRRAAALELVGGELPEWEPRPMVSIIGGHAALPHLVPWALRQADIARARWLNRPAWADTALGRICLAVAALQARATANPNELRVDAQLLLRPLNALWQGADQPTETEFVELIAAVLWHHNASGAASDDDKIWRSGKRWFERALAARKAWATAKASQGLEARDLEDLACSPPKSPAWIGTWLLAQTDAFERGDGDRWSVLQAVIDAAWSPDPRPSDAELTRLAEAGLDPPPDDEWGDEE